MVNELAQVFETEYDKTTFTLAIPKCFNDLHSKDAHFELSVSSTIQPLYLEYKHNVVTRSIAAIFVNPPKTRMDYTEEATRKFIAKGKNTR